MDRNNECLIIRAACVGLPETIQRLVIFRGYNGGSRRDVRIKKAGARALLGSVLCRAGASRKQNVGLSLSVTYYVDINR